MSILVMISMTSYWAVPYNVLIKLFPYSNIPRGYCGGITNSLWTMENLTMVLSSLLNNCAEKLPLTLIRWLCSSESQRRGTLLFWWLWLWCPSHYGLFWWNFNTIELSLQSFDSFVHDTTTRCHGVRLCKPCMALFSIKWITTTWTFHHCNRNPPVTGGFPSQRASDAEIVSIWWRHRGSREVPVVKMTLNGSQPRLGF